RLRVRSSSRVSKTFWELLNVLLMASRDCLLTTCSTMTHVTAINPATITAIEEKILFWRLEKFSITGPRVLSFYSDQTFDLFGIGSFAGETRKPSGDHPFSGDEEGCRKAPDAPVVRHDLFIPQDHRVGDPVF